MDAGAARAGLPGPLTYPTRRTGHRAFESEDGPELLLTFGAVFGNRDPGAVIGGAMSVNAVSGEVEWQIDRNAELFTVAVPVQPRGDQDNLYLFGGKRGVLMAVDVERGEMRFQAEPYYDASREAGVWNYYTGIEVRDINADGIGEFLVTNGGDDYADIGDPRPPGWLEVLSGADLSVIRDCLYLKRRRLTRRRRCGHDKGSRTSSTAPAERRSRGACSKCRLRACSPEI